MGRAPLASILRATLSAQKPCELEANCSEPRGTTTRGRNEGGNEAVENATAKAPNLKEVRPSHCVTSHSVAACAPARIGP